MEGGRERGRGEGREGKKKEKERQRHGKKKQEARQTEHPGKVSQNQCTTAINTIIVVNIIINNTHNHNKSTK